MDTFTAGLEMITIMLFSIVSCLEVIANHYVIIHAVNMTSSTCHRVPLMTDNPIYDDNHHYDVIPGSCDSKPDSQRLKKQVSPDFRWGLFTHPLTTFF